MKSTKIKVPLVLLFVLLITSCAYKVPCLVQPNSFYDIPKDEYEVKVVSKDEVEGRSSFISIFGITLGDAGIFAAQKDALSKIKNANALVNMKVDTEVQNILYIYSSYTTIVRGFPVKLTIKTEAAQEVKESKHEEKVQAVVKPPNNMVLIPQGEFTMGSDSRKNKDEKPAHQVFLNAFYIDVYEVTNKEYEKFLTATNHDKPRYWNDKNFNEPNQPVVGVSWDDAATFAEWAGKRLPTEAEWEKAARGTEAKQYTWGNFKNPDYSNLSWGKLKHSSVPVGSFENDKSVFGAYDMTGNVSEWTQDYYDAKYYKSSPASNPRGPVEGSEVVIKGGDWHNKEFSTLSYRGAASPHTKRDSLGFRCIKDAN